LSQPNTDRLAVRAKLVPGVLVAGGIDPAWNVPGELPRSEPVGDLDRPELFDDRIQHVAGEPLEGSDGAWLIWKVWHSDPAPGFAGLDQVTEA
jgi:hypothetical protein